MIEVDGVKMHRSLDAMLVPVGSLKEHPENPRMGQVGPIKESIQANGLYKPLVVQKSTGYVLAGNHTLRALTELGASRVPIVYVDVEDQRAKAILLADNRTSELGNYDEIQLADLLTELSGTGELLGTGYSEDDLSDLLVTMEPPPPAAERPLTTAEKEAKYNEDGLDITVGFADGKRKVGGRRMMVLDLPVPTWLWLQQGLETLSDELHLESNQEVVLHLVAEATGREVPKDDAA